MGRNNRQRRAEKRRRAHEQRRTHRTHNGHPPGEPPPGGASHGDRPRGATDHDLTYLVALAADRLRNGRVDEYGAAVDTLVHHTPRVAVERAVTGVLERDLASLWLGGWQPRDVARIVRRRLASVHLAVAIAAIAGESLAYLGSRAIADQRWLAQLDELGARPTWTQGQPYLATAGAAVGSTWERTVAGAIEVLALLESLPRLPELIPPPRAWGRDTARPLPTGIDERLLTRIRALLAKAESTEFPDEAEALTTKAQELMSRHAIDEAALGGGRAADDPVGRRIGIDDPYSNAKSYLLTVVAEANRCQAVLSTELGFTTVFGLPADLDGAEVLFTSLLVQATTALRVLGAAAPPGAHARSRSFREAFYVGFAARIGERLQAASATAVDEGVQRHGAALLPVLAQRRSNVDEAVSRAFRRVAHSSVGGRDRAGRLAGQVAADQAMLGPGGELAASAARSPTS